MSAATLVPERKFTRSPSTLDEPNHLHGYAARFNEESDLIFDKNVCDEPFVEVIKPGAFARTLRENPNIRSLSNHNREQILGCTKAGTLKLWEDEFGLAFVNELADTTAGRDARENVRRGDIDGCSFYGYTLDDMLEYREGLPPLHTILEIELVEVTPACTFPAHESTSVMVREKIHQVVGAKLTPTPLLNLAIARLTLSAD